MNLLTQKQLADLAGVSSAAITKARKNKRVEYYQGTKKYDTDSPLNRSFLQTIPKERLNKPAIIPKNGEVVEPDNELGKKLEEALTDVQEAQAKKLIEEAELKKQQRIEKELKNATRRAELLEAKLVNKSLMLYLDQWHNENYRSWKAEYYELKRIIIKVLDGEISDNEARKIHGNWILERTDKAKNEVVRRLNDISETQAKS